jgi:hypothetical protein
LEYKQAIEFLGFDGLATDTPKNRQSHQILFTSNKSRAGTQHKAICSHKKSISPPLTSSWNNVFSSRTVLDFEGLGINVLDSCPATNAGVMLESTAAKTNSQDLREIPILNLTPEHASGDATMAPPRRPTRRSLGEEMAEAATEQATTAATTRMLNTTAAAGGRGGCQGS